MTSQVKWVEARELVPAYLSLSARVLVDLEAMNMVESIGNVVRHRKASVVYRLGSGGSVKYELKTVPAVSGEALRHAYQTALAEIAHRMSLPVCDWCRRGEFIKHGVTNLWITEDADDGGGRRGGGGGLRPPKAGLFPPNQLDDTLSLRKRGMGRAADVRSIADNLDAFLSRSDKGAAAVLKPYFI